MKGLMLVLFIVGGIVALVGALIGGDAKTLEELFTDSIPAVQIMLWIGIACIAVALVLLAIILLRGLIVDKDIKKGAIITFFCIGCCALFFSVGSILLMQSGIGTAWDNPETVLAISLTVTVACLLGSGILSVLKIKYDMEYEDGKKRSLLKNIFKNCRSIIVKGVIFTFVTAGFLAFLYFVVYEKWGVWFENMPMFISLAYFVILSLIIPKIDYNSAVFKDYNPKGKKCKPAEKYLATLYKDSMYFTQIKIVYVVFMLIFAAECLLATFFISAFFFETIAGCAALFIGLFKRDNFSPFGYIGWKLGSEFSYCYHCDILGMGTEYLGNANYKSGDWELKFQTMEHTDKVLVDGETIYVKHNVTTPYMEKFYSYDKVYRCNVCKKTWTRVESGFIRK